MMREGWMTEARIASPENLEIAEHVVESLEAWERGEMPTEAARKLCTGYERFVAICHVIGEGRELLNRFLDVCIAEDAAARQDVVTATGIVSAADIREFGGIVRRVNGQKIVVWPFTPRVY